MRVNSDKTQVMAFHIQNREEKRSLKLSWNGVDLENTAQPKYLCVTFVRTLSYKQHIQNTKMKVASRINLLMKLARSKWGPNTSITRTRVLALKFSILSPNSRRDAYDRMERTKQMKLDTHSLYGHIPVRSRLMSRKDFMTSAKPSYFPRKAVCSQEMTSWEV